MKDNEELVEVVSDCEPLLVQERRQNFGLLSLKILSGVFLVCCVWYLFLGISRDLPPAPDNENEVSDLSVGEWIPNPAGPQYTNETCNHIQSYTNCLQNGRPDRGYLYWRWKPSACDLPPFDPVKFLNAMSDKSWAFIGDSILSNHVYSFICLLSKVEEPHETYHDSTYKTRTWYYPFHNFTLYVIWAPYLVFYETAGKHGDASETNIELHLDMLDSQWTKEYDKFDYVVLSGSQWFYKSSIMIEDNQVIGCHNCPYGNLRELGVEEPYRKALQLSLKFIATSVHKPFVILRTWTPSHYESGDWPNERICNRSEPFKEGEIKGDPTDLKMRRIEIEEFDKAAVIGARNGVQMKVLDTYHLSLLRPDGHPGPYGKYHPFDGDDKKNINAENDCIHWCLPGPIDSWNDLLMKMVIDDDEDAHDPASGLC